MIESNQQANTSNKVERDKEEIYSALLTKLVSLDAELEAARSGEAGTEFAVSANEAGSSAIQTAVGKRKQRQALIPHPE